MKITYVILVSIIFIFFTPITEVNSFYENDPNKPTKKLLEQIRTSSQQQTQQNNVAMALPTFSALLVRLSNEASKTADKNVQLSNQNILMQKKLLRITWVMLVINILMLTAQIFKFFGFFNFFVKRNNHITKITDITSQTDKQEIK